MATILFRSLDDYRAAQIATNARKLANVFACEAELQAVASDLLAHVQPATGICHGARNGWEVESLRNLLGCDVQGTDIAPTAGEHGLIQMDFHHCPEAWEGYFDFAYSNSLDHAHTPIQAVAAWVWSLRPGGRLYLSHCRNSEHAKNLADCYGATLGEYEELVGDCCTHVKTIWLGDQTNPDGGAVKSLAVIVGERVA